MHGLSKKNYLGDKLSNDNFLCSFKNNELIILTETWSNEELSIPGFHLFTIPAKKHRMKTWSILWCKLDKHFFHTKKDIFVCAAYIPPKESPYFNSDIFHELEGDIAKLTAVGPKGTGKTTAAKAFLSLIGHKKIWQEGRSCRILI